MKTIEIFVPYDSGFPGGGGGGHAPIFEKLFFFVCAFIEGVIFSFRCFFTPFKVIKELQEKKEYRQKIDHNHKVWQEENIKSGKNPDGSFVRNFPASTTLYEAMRQCDLTPDYEMNHPNSFVKELKDIPLGELTKEQIDYAVMSCQIATW